MVRTKFAFLLALGSFYPFCPQALAQDVTAASGGAAVTTTPKMAPKPPTELETLRAEAVTLRQQLDRQQLVVDNSRAQLDQLRAEMKVKDELIVLGRTRNAELYKLGTEILGRYSRKGFGEVLATSEPFVQNSRVRLENLAQDYEDKLRAARFTADTLPPSVESRMKADLAGQPAAASQNQ